MRERRTPVWIFVVIAIAVVGIGVGGYLATRGGGGNGDASARDAHHDAAAAPRTASITIHPPQVAPAQARPIRSDRVLLIRGSGSTSVDAIPSDGLKDGALSLAAIPDPDAPVALESGKMGKKLPDLPPAAAGGDVAPTGVVLDDAHQRDAAGVPLVLVDRDVPADVFVDELRGAGGRGVIAVSTGDGDRVRAFEVAFVGSDVPPTDDRVAISLAGGHTPSAEELAAASGKQVWIDPAGTTTDALVTAMAALSAKGATAIHLGAPPAAAPDAGKTASCVANAPAKTTGAPNTSGDLDKAEIRRVVKRSIDKITYCYEKELLAKPGLKGTVTTKFFIAPDGSVASATATGVDPDVATCVAGVVCEMKFPKPKGGGGVEVTYPFAFRSTGD